MYEAKFSTIHFRYERVEVQSVRKKSQAFSRQPDDINVN